MLSLSFWPLLTRLGEAQLLLPLALLASCWLVLRAGERPLASRWMAALSAAVAVTTASKVAFMGWGWGSAAWDFTGFSGHAMFAAATLPVLGWVAAQGAAARQRVLAVCGGVGCGVGLAALVAYSRLEVHAHSASEALLGSGLGFAASAWALRQATPLRLAVPVWLPLCMVVAMLAMPVGAPRSRTHDWVTQLSLQLSGRDRPFTRYEMHRRARPVPPHLQRSRLPSPPTEIAPGSP